MFLYLRFLHVLLIISSLGWFILASPRIQCYCRIVKKNSVQQSGLKSLQLNPLIWETVSPRTHKPEIVNESLPRFCFISFWELCTRANQGIIDTLRQFKAFLLAGTTSRNDDMICTIWLVEIWGLFIQTIWIHEPIHHTNLISWSSSSSIVSEWLKSKIYVHFTCHLVGRWCMLPNQAGYLVYNGLCW